MDTRPVIITHTGLRPYIILIPNITRNPVVIAKIYFFIEKSYPYDDMSLIECRLETGRTHQIRVHMSYIGYPVYGDPKYGKKKDDQSHGQFLHAKKLGFIHPTTGEYLEFECPLPDYFQAKLDELKGE